MDVSSIADDASHIIADMHGTNGPPDVLDEFVPVAPPRCPTDAVMGLKQETGDAEVEGSLLDAMGTQTEIVKQEEAMEIASSLLIDVTKDEIEIQSDDTDANDTGTMYSVGGCRGDDISENKHNEDGSKVKTNEATKQNHDLNPTKTAAERLIEKFKLFNKVSSQKSQNPDDAKIKKEGMKVAYDIAPSSLVLGKIEPANQRMKPPFEIPKKLAKNKVATPSVAGSVKKRLRTEKNLKVQMRRDPVGQRSLKKDRQKPPSVKQNQIYMQKVKNLKKNFNLKLRERLLKNQNLATMNQSKTVIKERYNSSTKQSAMFSNKKSRDVSLGSSGCMKRPMKAAGVDTNESKNPYVVQSSKGPPFRISVKIMCEKGPLSTKTTSRGVINRVDKAVQITTLKKLAESNNLTSTKPSKKCDDNSEDGSSANSNPLTIREQNIKRLKDLIKKQEEAIEKIRSEKQQPRDIENYNLATSGKEDSSCREIVNQTESSIVNKQELTLPNTDNQDGNIERIGSEEQQPGDIKSLNNLTTANVGDSDCTDVVSQTNSSFSKKQELNSPGSENQNRNILSNGSLKYAKYNWDNVDGTSNGNSAKLQTRTAQSISDTIMQSISMHETGIRNSIPATSVSKHSSDNPEVSSVSSGLPKIIGVCSLAGYKLGKKPINVPGSVVQGSNTQSATVSASKSTDLSLRNLLQQPNDGLTLSNNNIIRTLLSAKDVLTQRSSEKQSVSASASSVSTASANHVTMPQHLSNPSSSDAASTYSSQMSATSISVTHSQFVASHTSQALSNPKQTPIKRLLCNVSTANVNNNRDFRTVDNETKIVPGSASNVTRNPVPFANILRRKSKFPRTSNEPSQSVDQPTVTSGTIRSCEQSGAVKQTHSTNTNIPNKSHLKYTASNIDANSAKWQFHKPPPNAVVISSSPVPLSLALQHMNSKQLLNSAVLENRGPAIPDLCLNSDLLGNMAMPKSNQQHVLNPLPYNPLMSLVNGNSNSLQPSIPALSYMNVNLPSSKPYNNPVLFSKPVNIMEQGNTKPPEYQRVILIQDHTQQRFALYPVSSQNVPGSFLVKVQHPAITRQRVPAIETVITSLQERPTTCIQTAPIRHISSQSHDKMPKLVSIVPKLLNSSANSAPSNINSANEGKHRTTVHSSVVPSSISVPKLASIHPSNLRPASAPIEKDIHCNDTGVSSVQISQPSNNTSSVLLDTSPYWLKRASRGKNALPENLRLVIDSCNTGNIIEDLCKQVGRDFVNEDLRLRLGMYENQFVLNNGKQESWKILPQGADEEFLKLLGLEQVIEAVEHFQIPSPGSLESESGETKRSPENEDQQIFKPEEGDERLKRKENTEDKPFHEMEEEDVSEDATSGDNAIKAPLIGNLDKPSCRSEESSNVINSVNQDSVCKTNLKRKRVTQIDMEALLQDQTPCKKTAADKGSISGIFHLDDDFETEQNSESQDKSADSDCSNDQDCGTESSDSEEETRFNADKECEHRLKQVFVHVQDVIKSGQWNHSS